LEKKDQVHPSIVEAVDFIRSFITETTNIQPTDEEIAGALKKYFVLNEIKDYIVMLRRQDS
jgi:hypothetical protein